MIKNVKKINNTYKTNKSKIYKIMLVLVLCGGVLLYIGANNFLVASSDSDKTVEIYKVADNAKASKVSDANFMLIQRLNDNLKQQVSIINSKIESLRKTDAYNNFPAVRLNVDTPMFGISDIVNNELKITYEVSNSDISAHYSINDIINKNKIKVPSYTVASLVVKTRDIDINKDMTQSDANVVIFKLLEYLSQAESINTRLDGQINDILKGYVSKDKKSVVDNINNDISDIENKNINVYNTLNQLYLLKVDNITDYINSSNSMYTTVENYKKLANNNLTKIDILNNINKDLENKQLTVINTSNDIQKTYDSKILNINKAELLSNVYEKIKYQNDYTSKYISSSDGTFQGNRNFCYDNEINNLNSLVEKTYGITSKNISDQMQKIKDDIEKQNQDYQKSLAQTSQIQNSSTANNLNNSSNDENITLLKTLTTTYLDYLNKQAQFIQDNMNMLIKDSTSKLTNIGKNTNYDVSNYIEYVDVDYYNDIDKIKQNVNNSSINSMESYIENLKKELQVVLDNNLKINKLYKAQQVKSSDMNRDNSIITNQNNVTNENENK